MLSSCFCHSEYSNVSHMFDLFGKGTQTNCHLNRTKLLTTAKAKVNSQNVSVRWIQVKKAYRKGRRHQRKLPEYWSVTSPANRCSGSTINSQQVIDSNSVANAADNRNIWILTCWICMKAACLLNTSLLEVTFVCYVTPAKNYSSTAVLAHMSWPRSGPRRSGK